jgi:hypothetical protein
LAIVFMMMNSRGAWCREGNAGERGYDGERGSMSMINLVFLCTSGLVKVFRGDASKITLGTLVVLWF